MQTNGKDIYINIKELPIINDVQAGDFFIVETTQGTNIVDFSNIIIPPENVSFYSEIEDLRTDVDSLSDLYFLQTALTQTISTILDNKIDTTAAALQTNIDGVSGDLYNDFYLVGGAISFVGTTTENQVGRRCTAVRNGIGNYSVIFNDPIATAVASSNQDKTIIESVDGNVAIVQTFQLSYNFNVSGGITAFSAITSLDTTLSYEPVDADLITVVGI